MEIFFFQLNLLFKFYSSALVLSSRSFRLTLMDNLRNPQRSGGLLSAYTKASHVE